MYNKSIKLTFSPDAEEALRADATKESPDMILL
jgi:hypothetical protein